MATMYERVGGKSWFDELVNRFYEGVETNPILRPLYPSMLEDAKDHLSGFLTQYWGGPADYSEQRGHPRLRMRHVGFSIGWAERDAWYNTMETAVKAGGLSEEDEMQMLDYFNTSATFLINRQDA